MRNLLTILLSLTLLISCSQKQEKEVLSEKPTVKIGFILPLSGDNAHLGQPQQYAAQLALEQLKNTKYNYQFIFEDDRLDPKLTSTAANKLINVDKVNAIISFSSTSGNVVAPLAQNNGIVHFVVGGADTNMAKGYFNFTHWTTPRAEADLMIKTLINKNLTHPVIITLNQQGCLAVKDALIKASENNPVQILTVEKFNPSERDFHTMLTRLSKFNPDIYILITFSPTLEILVEQMRKMNISTPITSLAGFEFSSNYGLLENCWYVNVSEIDDDLRQKFYEKLGANTPLVAVGNIFDTVNIISHAYENYPSTGKPSTEQIAQAILDLKTFDGVLGKLTIPPSGIIESPPTLKEIRNGKPVVVSRNL